MTTETIVALGGLFITGLTTIGGGLYWLLTSIGNFLAPLFRSITERHNSFVTTVETQVLQSAEQQERQTAVLEKLLIKHKSHTQKLDELLRLSGSDPKLHSCPEGADSNG